MSGSYDETTGIWTIGPMANGATANLALNGIVNGTGPYDLTATVIETSAPDPNLANNTRTEIVSPDASADLQISFFGGGFEPSSRQQHDLGHRGFQLGTGGCERCADSSGISRGVHLDG